MQKIIFTISFFFIALFSRAQTSNFTDRSGTAGEFEISYSPEQITVSEVIGAYSNTFTETITHRSKGGELYLEVFTNSARWTLYFGETADKVVDYKTFDMVICDQLGGSKLRYSNRPMPAFGQSSSE